MSNTNLEVKIAKALTKGFSSEDFSDIEYMALCAAQAHLEEARHHRCWWLDEIMRTADVDPKIIWGAVFGAFNEEEWPEEGIAP